ncbi:hypothetical protein G6F65_023007 [Rhizopus arrhizus]|nr:hypothetical protein G6F65_023007 [Rhizopus arrhizus]
MCSADVTSNTLPIPRDFNVSSVRAAFSHALLADGMRHAAGLADVAFQGPARQHNLGRAAGQGRNQLARPLAVLPPSTTIASAVGEAAGGRCG